MGWVVSRSGTALVPELARRLGLPDGLSEALAGMHNRAPVHGPGEIVCDLATMLIDGGDCVLDLVRAGGLALDRLAAAARAGGGRARGAAPGPSSGTRARAWEAGARPSELVLDFDSHLLECQQKEGAAPHRKGGFGPHPLLCWLDGSGEALAGVLRPGNAGANDGDDHVAVLDAALAQLPEQGRRDCPSWPGPTAPGRRASSPTRCASASCASRSATRSESRWARPRWRCLRGAGSPPSTATASRGKGPGWPS